MRQQEVEKCTAQDLGAEDAAAMASGHNASVQEMSYRFITLKYMHKWNRPLKRFQ
jgi:hypothetical protein